MKTKITSLLLLVCFIFSGILYAQETVISGTVSDESGVPLPSVNILIKGTNQGVQTDFDGKYTIEAAANDVLVFSFVGYTSQEVTVGNQTTIDLTLSQDGVNDMNTYWATREFGGRSTTGDVTVEAPYFEFFGDENDERSTFFYEGNGTLLTTKWQNHFANIPYIRLAEMILIRAEANFRLGTAVGMDPLSDINNLRARSGAEALGSVSLDVILEERKCELGFEGFALHDAKRLEQNIAGLAYDANQLVLPIPQREVDANPELEQNPGYTN